MLPLLEDDGRLLLAVVGRDAEAGRCHSPHGGPYIRRLLSRPKEASLI